MLFIIEFVIYSYSLPSDSEGELDQESIKLYCQNHIDPD